MPTPHLDKLEAALANDKLPEVDKPRLERALEVYRQWIRDLSGIQNDSGDNLDKSVRLLDSYKRYIDVDVIFDSEQDFLHRQRGQLKLDNSIIEEFLPWLLPSLPDHFQTGPTKLLFCDLF